MKSNSRDNCNDHFLLALIANMPSKEWKPLISPKKEKHTASEMRLWKLRNASKVEGVVQFFIAIWYRKNRRILKLFTEVHYSQTSRSSAGERQRPTLIKRNWRENFLTNQKEQSTVHHWLLAYNMKIRSVMYSASTISENVSVKCFARFIGASIPHLRGGFSPEVKKL